MTAKPRAKATKPDAPATVTLPARDLLRGLHNARLFASDDVYLPVICAVSIEATKSTLSFAATDRYCIGVERVEAQSSDAWSFLMDRRDVTLLMKLFTPKSADLTLTCTGTTLVIEPAKDMIGTPAVVITCKGLDGEFPRYRTILDKAATPKDNGGYEAGQMLGLNPRYLARFGRVKTDIGAVPMKVRILGVTSPVLVSIGDTFQGAIMPARLVDDVPATVRPKESAA